MIGDKSKFIKLENTELPYVQMGASQVFEKEKVIIKAKEEK